MSDPLSPYGRLGMLDEVGHRKFIIPAEVKGYFHSLKKKLHFVLLCIFLGLPWITLNGKQLLLLDIPQRRFHFFGIELFAHDTPLIFFLIMIFAIGLALVTALFGRVWCGWACPQTVFIEFVYRQIEKWTEGTYIERRKLRQEELSFKKLRKVSLKWILYAGVSLLISHSFIAYFTGSKELLGMMNGPPAQNFSYFVMVMAMTALLLFNFGWFREQFCVIVCPYGKFQSALMDNQTVTVMYDEKRGEPRKGSADYGVKKGDCVSCQRCVQVCPTKIDIRNGVQLECIGCTACIDACDDIMKKINKPTGLIRYKSFSERAVNWFRPRVLIYSAILILCASSLGILLGTSEALRIEILRARSEPYALRTEGSITLIQNHFNLRLENHLSESILVSVEAPQNFKLTLPENPVSVSNDQKRDVPLFVETTADHLINGKQEVLLLLRHGDRSYRKTITLIGPTHPTQ